ncbi:hypothetical protein IBA8402_30750 [Pseudomonas syringae]
MQRSVTERHWHVPTRGVGTLVNRLHDDQQRRRTIALISQSGALEVAQVADDGLQSPIEE